MANTIYIVVSCDNDYIILMAPMLKSIEQNHHTGEPIVVYMVGNSITSSSKKKIESSLTENKINIVWLKMEEAIPTGTKLPLHRSLFPLNVYVRLYIPYFIPKEIRKVLYLDVDMIVLDDISKLYNIDVSDVVMGAVQDMRVATFDNAWGGVLNYKELGLDAKSPYFNAGMLLINVERWKEENIAERVVETINKHISYAQYADQYGLNIVQANQWKPIEGKWNHFSSEQHTQQPSLIHYVSRKPIYQSYNGIEEYKTIFFKYLNQTAYKNFKPIGESKRYVKKLKVILEKVKAFLFK